MVAVKFFGLAQPGAHFVAGQGAAVLFAPVCVDQPYRNLVFGLLGNAQREVLHGFILPMLMRFLPRFCCQFCPFVPSHTHDHCQQPSHVTTCASTRCRPPPRWAASGLLIIFVIGLPHRGKIFSPRSGRCYVARGLIPARVRQTTFSHHHR